MIPIRLMLLGITLVASVGYAVYKHYKEQPQPQSYGTNPNPDYAYIVPAQPSTSTPALTDRTRKRKKSLTISDCSICLSRVYSTDNDTRKLSCGHFFHQRCIEAWFNSKKNCPMCREPVLST